MQSLDVKVLHSMRRGTRRRVGYSTAVTRTGGLLNQRVALALLARHRAAVVVAVEVEVEAFT